MKVLHKSLHLIVLPILLVSCSSGGSPPPPRVAPNLSDTPLTATVTANVAFETITVANTGGGALTACKLIDPSDSSEQTTLDGLTVSIATNNTDCEVNGTLSSTQTFTVRATNSGGSDDAMIAFTVEPATAIPNLSDTPLTATVTANVAFETITVANTGGGVLTACKLIDPSDSSEQTTLDGLTVSIATNNTDCEVNGSLSSTQTFTVRATNSGGSDDAMIAFTVTPVPILAAPNTPVALVLNRAITAGNEIIITNAETNPQGDIGAGSCTFIDDQGMATASFVGLRISTDTTNDHCLIQGTPDTPGSSTLMIEATTTGGQKSNTLSLPITVNLVPILAAPNTPVALVLNRAITAGNEIIITNAETNPQGDIGAGSCTFIDDQGMATASFVGLRISTDTTNDHCLIQGTPDTLGSSTLMIEATTTGGQKSNTLSLPITVNLVPILAAPNTPVALVLNRAITAGNEIIITNAETNPQGDIGAGSCTFIDDQGMATASFVGLRISTDTTNDHCLIQGTPDTLGSSTLMIEATTTGGQKSNTLSLPITVNPPGPSITPSSTRLRFAIGQSISRSLSFTNTGDPIVSCTANPVLPAGLSIDATTCAITGYPTAITTVMMTSHIISAVGSMGTNTQTISLETYAQGFPPNISDYSDISLTTGSATGLPIIFANQGDAPELCEVSSDNNGGERPLANYALEIVVSQSTCAIQLLEGATVPTGTLTQTTYELSAENNFGFSKFSIALTLDATTPNAPTLIAPTISDISLNTGQRASVEFTTGGGLINTCVTSSTLPQGLSIHPLTCAITGKTYQAQVQTPYTIMASNAGGMAMVDIRLTVTEVIPSFANIIRFAISADDLPFEIPNTGGAPQTCVVTAGDDASPTLASLNLQILTYKNTCFLDSLDGTAILAAPMLEPSYMLTAGNSAGTSPAITLNILYPPEFNRALDIANLVFTSSASDPDNPPWFSQTVVTQDGVDALQSGVIGDSAGRSLPKNTTCVQTIIDTTVLGAGRLSYYARISSQGIFDELVTYMNDSSDGDTHFSFEQDWTLRTHDFTTGTTTIRWCYEKNHATSQGSDAVWLDNFMYVPL